jgi:D-aminopeptidase
MRIIVMSDMEGVAGIVKWEQVDGGESLYEEGRKLYTEEINAVVRGARAGGATEIVVMDCHGAGKGWTFNSLLPRCSIRAANGSCRTSGRTTRTSSSRGATARSSSGCTRGRERRPAF